MWIFYIVVGVVLCAWGYFYSDYLKAKLEYKKHEDEYARMTLRDRNDLDIAKEKTKQSIEETKRLQLKADYRKEYNQNLY